MSELVIEHDSEPISINLDDVQDIEPSGEENMESNNVNTVVDKSSNGNEKEEEYHDDDDDNANSDASMNSSDNDDDSDDDDDDDSDNDNESTFDEFNFSSDEDDDTTVGSMMMNSDGEDSDEEDEIDYDDAEFNFDDVAQSIEYIQERYNFFKKSTVRDCSIYLLYIENKQVVHVEKSLFELEEDGSVSKDNIVELLQEKRIQGDKKYFIKELLQYNFNLTAESMINMFDEDDKFDDIEKMMKSLSRLSDIRFEDSIDIFKDKNSLFVMYTLEKPVRQSSNKRKSIKKGKSSGSSNRKTRRK